MAKNNPNCLHATCVGEEVYDPEFCPCPICIDMVVSNHKPWIGMIDPHENEIIVFDADTPEELGKMMTEEYFEGDRHMKDKVFVFFYKDGKYYKAESSLKFVVSRPTEI